MLIVAFHQQCHPRPHLLRPLSPCIRPKTITCIYYSHVYSDAARHIQHGGNPFDRATYRYTPFLAALLARLPTRESARYLFCLADALCGWILLVLRRRQRKQQVATTQEVTPTTTLADALWWLYNPLIINICTRGSAESGLVLLPVLGTVAAMTLLDHPLQRAVVGGLLHGWAMHAKLYPVIYTVSLATHCIDKRSSSYRCMSPPQPNLGRVLWVWMRRLLTPAPLLFGVISIGVFGALTGLAVHYYGNVALQEGLLYHFSRVDHRHNYSMHWYWIYLARAAKVDMAVVGRLLLIPQLILLLYTSLGVAPHNLPLALFLQTFLFVAHNKVITAQYFTWYLCLLPLCNDQFRLTPRVRYALVFLGCSIGFWLASAYCLEMRGMGVHRLVWIASSVFFVANINLLGALLASTTTVASKSKGD